MKPKKYILSILFFLALIFGTYYFIFKGYSISDFKGALSQISIGYLLLALLCMALWAIFESLYLKQMLKHLGYKINWYQALGYVFTECYFSAITPSSIGGQPIQMMEMNKDGIPYHTNSVVILLNTLIYKLALVTLAIVGMAFYWKDLFGFNHLYNWLVLLGFVTTILLMICFIVLVYSKKAMGWAYNLFLKIMKKFKFKKADEWSKKTADTIAKYQDAAEFTKEHPGVLIEAYLLLICQRLSIMAIAYFIYISFGFKSMSFFEIIAFQTCITLGADFTPLPGGVLVSESLLFQANQVIYGETLATPAMIIMRSISFYGIVIFALVYYLIFHFLPRKGAKEIKMDDSL